MKKLADRDRLLARKTRLYAHLFRTLQSEACKQLPPTKEGASLAATCARDMAIEEVIAGARLCLRKKIDIQVAMEPDFNLQSQCTCVLAKNHRSGNYTEAILDWKIRRPEERGFAPSKRVKLLLRDTGWDCFRLYNNLWTNTARFLREHKL